MLLWPSDSHASEQAIVARDSDGTSDRSPTSRRWDTRQADAVGSDREPDCAITSLRIDADRLQSARDGGLPSTVPDACCAPGRQALAERAEPSPTGRRGPGTQPRPAPAHQHRPAPKPGPAARPSSSLTPVLQTASPRFRLDTNRANGRP